MAESPTITDRNLEASTNISLKREPACFAFLIQVQDPTKDMPIEDTTIEWRESLSPFLHVATLIIPRQEIRTHADLTPAVHLVVRTRKPYQPERVRVALKATRSHEERTPEGGKRTLYAARYRARARTFRKAGVSSALTNAFSPSGNRSRARNRMPRTK